MFLFFLQFYYFLLWIIFLLFSIGNSVPGPHEQYFYYEQSPGHMNSTPGPHEQCRRAHVGARLTAALQILEL